MSMRRRIARCCEQANQSIWNQFDLSIMKRLLGISNHFVPLRSIHKLCLVLRVSAVGEGTARRRRRWLAAREENYTQQRRKGKNSHPPATAFAHMWIQCAFRKWNFSICQFFFLLSTLHLSRSSHNIHSKCHFCFNNKVPRERADFCDLMIKFSECCVCVMIFSPLLNFHAVHVVAHTEKFWINCIFFHHRAEGAARGIEKERRKKINDVSWKCVPCVHNFPST